MDRILTREEMVNAIDLKDYYRIPVDSRDLNYNKFYEDGEEVITRSSEYHSHNTHQLNEEELKEILLKLNEIQPQLKDFGL